MRFSTLLLALIPATTLAAPVPAPDFLGSLGDLLGKVPPIVGAVTDSIKRPELLLARLEVAGGLTQTKGALQSIIDETAGGANAPVSTTAKTALESIDSAQAAVNSIGQAILSGNTPQRSDQATVAQSLVEAQGPIGLLASQVVNSSIKLTNDINGATIGLALTLKGAQGVLDASGLSPADVGINAPLVASGPAVPSASPSPNQ